MIEYRVGNLLEQPDLTHIAHQANLYHTFGSGIARSIAEKWPRALEADKATPYGSKAKLSGWSISVGTPTIFNLYTQRGLGSTDRHTSYDAMCNALMSLEAYLQGDETVKLGLPYKMGCGLGNGNWEVVEALIREAFNTAPFTVVICRLPIKH